MELTKFTKEILDILRCVPKGRVTTYSELARAAGRPKAARAVGNALRKNPWVPRVPCHRVVKSSGALGGYAGGAAKKAELLRKEGVKIKKGKVFGFTGKFYRIKQGNAIGPQRDFSPDCRI